jgi:hypothetical protein
MVFDSEGAMLSPPKRALSHGPLNGGESMPRADQIRAFDTALTISRWGANV